MAAASDPALVARLREMITAFRVSDLVHTAVEFRLADHLADGPLSSAELAERCGAQPQILHRVLRAMARIELVSLQPDGRVALAPLGEPLRSDAPDSVYPFARLWASEMFKRTWMLLPHSVRTGEPSLNHLYGMGQFDYLSRHPDVAEVFNSGMLASTVATAAAVVDAYDFTPFSTVMDVGGGIGTLAAAIVRANPHLRGVVFDLPFCEAGATAYLASEGLSDRCTFVAGNFFEAIPAGADAYLMKWILHDWPDDRCAQILRSCRAAMAPEARLLLVESVLPPEGAPLTDAVFGDVTMVVHTGGRERTAAEFAALFEAAGLRLARVVPTRAAQSVVEAVVE